MAKDLIIRSSSSEFLIFKMQEKEQDIQVKYQDKNLWLTQKAMSKVFDVGIPAISKQLNNIFNDEELDKNSVVSKMEITASDNKNYNTDIYDLDAIIAVG